MDYKHKYLKYKIKYLNAKQKKIIGGSSRIDEKPLLFKRFFEDMKNKMGKPAIPIEKEEKDNFSDEEPQKNKGRRARREHQRANRKKRYQEQKQEEEKQEKEKQEEEKQEKEKQEEEKK